ncbi:hypothetical protein X770_03165 [Mesorhizobium sp. LSJC269B00]|nr:hypothetical protein X770_03165 [Mesorhizobium sp. LSJC269B00]
MAIGSIFHLEQNAADAVTPELRRAVLMEFLARQSLAPNTSRSKDQHMDIVVIGIDVLFFTLSLAYIKACDAL